MNRFPEFVNQVLFSIALSLSATTIYAEVSTKGIESGNTVEKTAVKQAIVSTQDVLLGQPSEKAAMVWQLNAEQWELARSGETILSLPVLNQLVNTWLAEKQKKIEIQYPGGEDGEFWVQELTDWLVSLGIPSKNMVTTPGSGADDVIKFNIIK
ncbi:MAG: hypothetical protein BMS9Abin19_0521 [Gammaproteobacteria bacterium]|nr:MAG: hypothetical protein BMS9Abin19_0521 [Gammaproteobacteria bacterium]